jgi:hypothetical protein
VISYIILLSNPCILYNISNCYTFVLKNRVIIATKSVLINVYLFTLVFVGIIAFTSFMSRDLVSCDSASPNRVAEEVYPTL